MGPQELPEGLEPLIWCPDERCRRWMGYLRIYLATNRPDRQHLRGAVCQSLLRTPSGRPPRPQPLSQLALPTYPFTYASQLPAPHSQGFAPYSQPYSAPSQPANPTALPAQTDSATASFGVACKRCAKRGKYSRGNTSGCPENLCRTCCEILAVEAIKLNKPRQRCAISAHRPSSEPPQPSQAAMSRQPSPAKSLSDASPTHVSTQPQATSSAPDPTPVTEPKKKSLAMPIGPAWVEAAGTAARERDMEKSRKVENEELMDIQRNTVPVILYHEAGEPVVLSWVARNTWPRVQLQQHPILTKELGLTPTSMVDVYLGESAGWKTHSSILSNPKTALGSKAISPNTISTKFAISRGRVGRWCRH
ncbi:hypothetical protein NMY22_g20043 [Coprinellus aureogranulatus]|nr:hypothetical protein NMY22_g20043 [Coprinellus aureogranulatus]